MFLGTAVAVLATRLFQRHIAAVILFAQDSSNAIVIDLHRMPTAAAEIPSSTVYSVGKGYSRVIAAHSDVLSTNGVTRGGPTTPKLLISRKLATG